MGVFVVYFIGTIMLSQHTMCADLSLDSEESSAIAAPLRLSPHVEASAFKPDNKTITSTTNRRTQGRSWNPQPRTTTTEASVIKTFNNMSETEMVHQAWQKFEKSAKKLIDGHMKKALPMFLRMSSDANLSGECQKSILALVQGVRGMKSWAYRMLDASAKIPSGILDGTLSDFGDYDQCLDITKLDSKNRTQFSGQ
ncbi:uncharacterized protein [Parasteatoda tepidariorum]|uniref:uncharacterized protein n=1 Tax=Parasteatoda tepidariorum TaxID=114398 RepID=UPI001C7286ED|nr:uncharacterized protein LOC122269899 [Parasteatoda tepidariorum]